MSSPDPRRFSPTDPIGDTPRQTYDRRRDVAQRPTRREFIRDLGVGAATLPFLLTLPGLGFAKQARRKQRLVIMFSPDGVIPGAFWPDEEGESFTLKGSLTPLEPCKDRLLTL